VVKEEEEYKRKREGEEGRIQRREETQPRITSRTEYKTLGCWVCNDAGSSGPFPIEFFSHFYSRRVIFTSIQNSYSSSHWPRKARVPSGQSRGSRSVLFRAPLPVTDAAFSLLLASTGKRDHQENISRLTVDGIVEFLVPIGADT
jgi:hypothetical protein